MLLNFYHKMKSSDNTIWCIYDIEEGKVPVVYNAILALNELKFACAVVEKPCKNGIIFQNNLKTAEEAFRQKEFSRCHIYVYHKEKPVYFIVDAVQSRLYLETNDDDKLLQQSSIAARIMKQAENV